MGVKGTSLLYEHRRPSVFSKEGENKDEVHRREETLRLSSCFFSVTMCAEKLHSVCSEVPGQGRLVPGVFGNGLRLSFPCRGTLAVAMVSPVALRGHEKNARRGRAAATRGQPAGTHRTPEGPFRPFNMFFIGKKNVTHLFLFFTEEFLSGSRSYQGKKR